MSAHSNLKNFSKEMVLPLLTICKRDFPVQKCNALPIKKQTDFQISAARSVFRDTKSMKFLGPKIRETLPRMLKQLENLKAFRKAIK